ncbi:MAG: DUF1365 domain-containing protein [Thermodesulfobacteriota bacterium]|nr:DUF1365 domain-containing protein [Thermodesulfobacteriota bacterium]
MFSCIYEGRVRHRRFRPVSNVFWYRLFMMYLDLSELDQVFAGRLFWSVGTPNLAYFRRRDHLGDPHVTLDRAVRHLVEARLGERPLGPIRLLTHLRYFGHNFNPVSFYYCFDQAGKQVETIVAEIHNTPWGEEHCYVLAESSNEHGLKGWKQHRFSKQFHVSPFMDMGMHYDWRFREPGDTIRVHFNSYDGRQKLFDATLSLERREMNGENLARVLLAYPPMTLKVVAMIYWQALRLKWKGVPVYTHPAKRLSGRAS